MNPYLGNEFQLCGVERYRLEGGKAGGSEIAHAKNGLGLDIYLDLDRNSDIACLTYKGTNIGYLSPSGIVNSRYFNERGDRWLQSFFGGFLTTAGLDNVGVPCEDGGVPYPLHGHISNTPVSSFSSHKLDGRIVMESETIDEAIFSRKLKFTRKITLYLDKNAFKIEDRIENRGDAPEPVMYLLHMNLGYPLLTEKAHIHVDTKKVTPRDGHAAEEPDRWNVFDKPTPGYRERCYYHTMKGNRGRAGLYNPDLGFGVLISFDAVSMPCFTEWKMPGVRDYVLGLEPGNAYPEGRASARENGRLVTIAPGESVLYGADVSIVTDEDELGF